jgi:hypothetical protein
VAAAAGDIGQREPYASTVRSAAEDALRRCEFCAPAASGVGDVDRLGSRMLSGEMRFLDHRRNSTVVATGTGHSPAA